MSEKLFKTKTTTQVFAWNKYVKLFLLIVSALVNVINSCALSLLVALLLARNTHDK